MKKIMLTLGLVVTLLTACNKTEEEPQLSYDEQLAIDVAIIDKYLADNSITTLSDPRGLRYVITLQGTGVKPTLSSTITANYVGKFLVGGGVFDQSTTPFTSSLRNVIAGWQIAFPLLNKGSKATLYIPSGLGYGQKGSGPIPPNSNLIFDVEFIDVK